MKRIQRKRTKGWRMPLNTIYVGRPTRWGNPYTISDCGTREKAISMYELWLRSNLIDDPHFLDPLIGKDLACWCRLDEPCHADIIIKMLGEKKDR